MGVFDRWMSDGGGLGPVGSRSGDPGLKSQIATLEWGIADLKANLPNIIEVNEHSITMAGDPVLERTPAKPDYREIGTTGQSNLSQFVRDDYNLELRGSLGLRMFDRMRKSDGQVRGTLRLVKTPVLAARWYIEPFQDDPKYQEQATFIENALFVWMTTSWPTLLTEILLMLDYGHYPFEKVYAKRMVNGKERVIWKKFAPRHPLDIAEWSYDAHGGPTGVKVRPLDGFSDEVTIPIDKLAVFTYEMEAGNLQGVSVLRSAYKHWYFKEMMYKIDAMQKERHGLGIPIIKLPVGFSDQDRALAQEIGRNLRANEKAHVVLPPLWEIAMLRLEGNNVDALKSVEHHDMQIARNILGQFLNDPTQVDKQQDLFLKATRYIADVIRDVFNKYCIPQLIKWNWGIQEGYPELRVRRIGDSVDWRTMSFAIRNFVGAGIVVPDEVLEKWVRSEMDLPKPDSSTARIIVAPQQAGTIPDGQPDGRPGRGGASTDASKQNGGLGNRANAPTTKGIGHTPLVGLPRQSTAAGMQTGTGGGNTGNDKSGG